MSISKSNNQIPEYLLNKKELDTEQSLSMSDFWDNEEFYNKYLESLVGIEGKFYKYRNYLTTKSSIWRDDIKEKLAINSVDLDKLDIQWIKNSLTSIKDYIISIPSISEKEWFDDEFRTHFSIYDKIHQKIHYLYEAKRITEQEKTTIMSIVKSINSQISIILKNKNTKNVIKANLKSVNKPKEWFPEKESKQFDIKYWEYHKRICENIWSNPILAKSQIEKESSYIPHNKNWEHIWFFQLSQWVVLDMKNNGVNYSDYFSKLDPSIVDLMKTPKSKSIISQIINLSKKWDYWKEWKNAFSKVDRSDPYVNILLWNIYSLDWMRFNSNWVQFANFNWSKGYTQKVMDIYEKKTGSKEVFV